MTTGSEPGPDRSGTLDTKVQAFARLLRDNGVRVSVSEVLDAGEALMATGLEDRDDVRNTLRTTLVKSRSDLPIFEHLFGLYFDLGGAITGELAEALLSTLATRRLPAEALAEVQRALQATWEGLDPLTQAILDGASGQVGRQLGQAAWGIDFDTMHSFMQQGLFAQRLFNAAGGQRVDRDLSALTAELDLGETDQAVVEEALRAMLQGLRAAARRYVETEFRQRNVPRDGQLPGYRLEDRPLYTLNKREIEAMKAVVARLARRLKERIDRRRRPKRRGHFHIQRTMRRSLAYGGLPMRPVFRERRRDKPDLVVLVDVSDSVRNVARFFLQFAHALQDVFDRVRSFVFVADLGEATHLFKAADVHRAVDLAFAGQVISLHAKSNYGRALQTFEREHLAAISHRTTVFILGDGRNNYNAPQDHVLAAIKRRARRLVWLCPEPEISWGFGDSEMLTYARHCDQTAAVRTVADLSRVLERVVG